MWGSFPSRKQIQTIPNILEHTNPDNGHIFNINKKKWLKGSGEKESPQKVNKRNSRVEKDTEYEKDANRLLSPRLTDFSWLRLDVDKCFILPYLQEIFIWNRQVFRLYRLNQINLFYIGSLYQVWFKQDYGLFKVWLSQILLYKNYFDIARFDLFRFS